MPLFLRSKKLQISKAPPWMAHHPPDLVLVVQLQQVQAVLLREGQLQPVSSQSPPSIKWLFLVPLIGGR